MKGKKKKQETKKVIFYLTLQTDWLQLDIIYLLASRSSCIGLRQELILYEHLLYS